MSRIGKLPIALPKGVQVTIAGGELRVKGPKGELSMPLPARTSAVVDDAVLSIHRDDESRVARANHGLARALANNLVVGVSAGFSKRLEVQGIGYRADVRGQTLVLNLGYSHPVNFEIPAGITITTDKDNKITVSGIDRGQVGQVAANIRAYRSPDRYKGKGIRYEGEYVSLKAGKSA